MLIFLGKDIFRWLRQCVDFSERSGDPGSRIPEQSFASHPMVVESPPAAVLQISSKIWGGGYGSPTGGVFTGYRSEYAV